MTFTPKRQGSFSKRPLKKAKIWDGVKIRAYFGQICLKKWMRPTLVNHAQRPCSITRMFRPALGAWLLSRRSPWSRQPWWEKPSYQRRTRTCRFRQVTMSMDLDADVKSRPPLKEEAKEGPEVDTRQRWDGKVQCLVLIVPLLSCHAFVLFHEGHS